MECRRCNRAHDRSARSRLRDALGEPKRESEASTRELCLDEGLEYESQRAGDGAKTGETGAIIVLLRHMLL